MTHVSSGDMMPSSGVASQECFSPEDVERYEETQNSGHLPLQTILSDFNCGKQVNSHKTEKQI